MRWIKRLFGLILVVAIGGAAWVAFALWSGMYSVYTYPPASTKHPDGATLLVERAEREPMFNSPQRVIPPPPPKEKGGGLGFSSSSANAKPVERRTVLELPYIDWAYKKSLEPETLP